MADQTANMKKLYQSGQAEVTILYQVKDVTSADTVSVSADFSKVKAAVNVPAGGSSTTTAPTPSGTTITLNVGTVDTLFLLVVGDAA
jgi:hypothetical protein